jgi:hypothetical protein
MTTDCFGNPCNDEVLGSIEDARFFGGCMTIRQLNSGSIA